MMAQYLNLKNQYQDALLFYRMGDFYELFFEDAVAAAEALDIALTKRGKHLGEDVAMCGVPHHSAESYILLTVGDGLVAQIPSLLLAMATATIVTRISSDDNDLAGQISSQMGLSKAWVRHGNEVLGSLRHKLEDINGK